MKNYNFTLFHKGIDSICEAYTAADKAKMRLIGAIYEADYDIHEDDIVHEIQYKLESIKADLKEVKELMIKLDQP